MKEFAELFQRLDETTKTKEKVEAMAQYFKVAPEDDRVWAIALLSGKRPKRTVNTTLLRAWCAEEVGIPLWLFEETYHIVGDLAETIALLVTQNKEKTQSLSQWVAQIIELQELGEEEKKAFILTAWKSINTRERFLFNKIITGGFRVGVSQRNMVKGLSKATGIEENLLTYKLTGNWSPQKMTYEELIFGTDDNFDISKPYPFYLAYPLEQKIETLGSTDDWKVEYKWDGIRGQLIKRNGEVHIWTRGEELVTEKYPELILAAKSLPNGIVIDGEILAWKDELPMNFASLQKRVGRKTLGKKLLTEVPVVLKAYDLIEYEGMDIRNQPQLERRTKLEALIKNHPHDNLSLSPIIKYSDWSQLIREDARVYNAEGFMIKKASGIYDVGRKKGNWWKWKVDPFTVDAVLTYAMRGHGRRANLYTDYTFGLWSEGELVTFAKAYSGLTDAEFRQVDRFVKKNTVERFGPVRQVVPELVFEIAFEAVSQSKRHKSGYAVRFPRILRWRQDKKAVEANSTVDLQHLLQEK
ncbi:MAG: ATP-dependent DNA ligase [Cyclobacteriaceae bacterium]